MLRKIKNNFPLIISSTYFLLGFFWIMFSDLVVFHYLSSIMSMYNIQLIKGTAFVLFTSVFVFLMMYAQKKRLNQKQTEIEEYAAKYKKLFFSNPIPMYVYDSITLKFLDVNNSAIEQYGFTREEFLSMTIFDLRPLHDKEKLLESMKKMTDGYQYDGVVLQKSKSGKIIYAEIESHGFEYEGRSAQVVIANNITQRIKTENEIKVAIEELNKFVYRASHDLRGPLARLIGLAYLMKIDPAKENNIDYVNMIYSTANLLDNILQRLLVVNTLKETTPNRATFNLYQLVEEVIMLEKEHPYSSYVNVINDVPKYLDAYSDKGIIKLALQNMINNSLTFSFHEPGTSYVKILASGTDENINIQISDNGSGIDKEVQNKIFDMFYRGSELSTGSGLGLFIVKTGLKKLGGTLELIRSDEETVFEINLPIAEHQIAFQSSTSFS